MLKEKIKNLLQNITGKNINTETNTIGGLVDEYNKLYVCVVTFSATPSSATIVVKQGEKIINPVDGLYYLKEGNYTYDAEAEGYVSKTNQTLTITNNDETTGTKTVNVVLTIND